MKKYIVCFYDVSLIQGFTSGVKQYNIFILGFFFLKEVLLKLCNECWVSVPKGILSIVLRKLWRQQGVNRVISMNGFLVLSLLMCSVSKRFYLEG